MFFHLRLRDFLCEGKKRLELREQLDAVQNSLDKLPARVAEALEQRFGKFRRNQISCTTIEGDELTHKCVGDEPELYLMMTNEREIYRQRFSKSRF